MVCVYFDVYVVWIVRNPFRPWLAETLSKVFSRLRRGEVNKIPHPFPPNLDP